MDNRTCLICTVPISVTYLGIDACRACAAFFKRTQIASRKFVCRQGDGKCAIRKHEKFMCRSCRYDKCVAFGMAYDLPVKKKPRRNMKVVMNEEIPSTSLPSKAKDSLIDRMEVEYKASHERRLVLEKEYVTRHNLKPYAHPTEAILEFFTANFDSFYELYRIAIHESTTLLTNVFSDFESLSIDHRATLFKNFIRKFLMIECLYLSDKYFNDNISFMASLTTCAEIQDIDQWVAVKGHIVNKDAFRTSIKAFTDDYMDLFGPMSKMNQLTEREFYALAVLNYCDIETLHLPEEIIEKAQITRAKIFGELQEYYRCDLKLNDFSKRLGHLMTWLMAPEFNLQEAGILMNAEMRMYATVFGLYSDDRLFREFFTD